ncbi:hypothetical protein B0H13DRAFT_1880588 [Mycena leptocephala]|nr:hypothetical protein B0H13DRAFT_1880588 [Mycena leptocephala]
MCFFWHNCMLFDISRLKKREKNGCDDAIRTATLVSGKWLINTGANNVGPIVLADCPRCPKAQFQPTAVRSPFRHSTLKAEAMAVRITLLHYSFGQMQAWICIHSSTDCPKSCSPMAKTALTFTYIFNYVPSSAKGISVAQVGAIASFILCRNRYANGDLAMALGIWLFACQAHVDVKRIFSRFGYSVSDTTAPSMTGADMTALCIKIAEAARKGRRNICLLLDNVQEYCDVFEQGIGRQSQLKVGIAGTCVELDDCAPGAFDAKPYHDKVALQERKTLTTDDLFDDIDWSYIRVVIPLHWTRVLIEFVPEFASTMPSLPELNHFLEDINENFRSFPVARHQRSTETQGMAQAIADFESQMGLDREDNGNLLTWIRGDGASYAVILRLTKYCTPLESFKNKITTPEIWHTGATELNSTAANHYGPATSSDLSSLSKCSNIAGFKRPSNIKSCDYYPTVRNLTLFWTAHVLDCGRVFLETEDLREYFRDLAAKCELPVLDVLRGYAYRLVDRYATQSAILTSLSASESLDPARENRVQEGSAWVAPLHADAPVPVSNANPVEEDPPPGLADIEEDPQTPRNPTMPLRPAEDTPTIPPKPAEAGPKVHQEKPGFDGDRVLRNTQIFLQDFGWWIEFSHSVPEGDIGRVWEIMKIWIFKFAGSSHQKYVSYLLEVYCMLRYEASKDLTDAILNNWLLNIKGELGRWLAGDQHQEHYNKWLEAMAPKHGGEFDDPFYRQTIPPIVHHFLEIKEEIETAFSFQHRGQTHTSPHLRCELHLLLTAFKEEEAHLFRSGRSLGHAAVNQFARGSRRLHEDKLEEFLRRSTVHGGFLEEFQRLSLKDGGDVLMRSFSPAGSDSAESNTSASTASTASTSSTSSSRSSASSEVDANEPDDDGEDLSDAKLSSGFTVDPETGFEVIGSGGQNDDAFSDEEEEIEEEAEAEEPQDSEVENSADEI